MLAGYVRLVFSLRSLDSECTMKSDGKQKSTCPLSDESVLTTNTHDRESTAVSHFIMVREFAIIRQGQVYRRCSGATMCPSSCVFGAHGELVFFKHVS